MNSATNASDYEKNFLERYFRSQAEKKIRELQVKMEDATPKQVREYQRKVQMIEQELEVSLRLVVDGEDCKKVHMVKKEADLVVKEHGESFVFKNVRIPLYLWDYLFSYQQEGVKWMIDLHMEGKGGILADEMGVGKTIQAVTFVTSLMLHNDIECVLVLCPATVVSQWIHEFKRVSPRIRVYDPKTPKKQGISVMSYDGFKVSRCDGAFDILILDEGHKIKNKDAQVTRAVKRIKSTSRFILTGTPIQNNLAELWSLFDFIIPGLLGTHVIFQEEFEEHIKQKHDPEMAYKYSVMLRAIIEPYILRRMKSQISHNLPGKTDNVIFVSLTEKQHSLYVKALESDKLRKALFDKKGLLGAIDHLRKICNHPFLIESKNWREKYLSGQDDLEEPVRDTDSEIGDDEYQRPEKIIDLSCKMSATMTLLRKWSRENKKTLIFSQTVQMQNIIEEAVKLKSYSYLKMSGDTLINQRSRLVEVFNKDPRISIFLLTTRVGGLGLNLTGASRIILYDPDWNPATDNQAKERIYRFGQKSAVEIYRIICRNTIEEKIYQKQIYKDCLSKKILSDPSIKIDKDAVIDLFSYHGRPAEGLEIAELGVAEVVDDKLVDVKEEDKKEFSIMKNFNSKKILTGVELIEFIERRENSLG